MQVNSVNSAAQILALAQASKKVRQTAQQTSTVSVAQTTAAAAQESINAASTTKIARASKLGAYVPTSKVDPAKLSTNKLAQWHDYMLASGHLPTTGGIKPPPKDGISGNATKLLQGNTQTTTDSVAVTTNAESSIQAYAQNTNNVSGFGLNSKSIDLTEWEHINNIRIKMAADNQTTGGVKPIGNLTKQSISAIVSEQSSAFTSDDTNAVHGIGENVVVTGGIKTPPTNTVNEALLSGEGVTADQEGSNAENTVNQVVSNQLFNHQHVQFAEAGEGISIEGDIFEGAIGGIKPPPSNTHKNETLDLTTNTRKLLAAYNNVDTHSNLVEKSKSEFATLA